MSCHIQVARTEIEFPYMKILYITKLDYPSGIGVLRKVYRQIELWSEIGVDTSHLNFSKYGSCFQINTNSTKTSNVMYYNHFDLILKFTKFLLFKNFLKNSDIIYMRWVPVLPNLVKLIFRNSKLIIEFNGIYEIENRSASLLKRCVLQLSHKLAIWQIDGSIVCSKEIYEHDKFQFKGNVLYVPNPIVRSSVAHSKPDKLVEKRLLFVGTPDRFWHGLAEINALASNLPDWEFDIIGYENQQHLSSNIHFYGIKTIEDTESIARLATAAIGPLNLRGAGLISASPLKISDYIGWGLPLIVAHQDFWSSELNYPRFMIPAEGISDENVMSNLRNTLEIWNKTPPYVSVDFQKAHRENLRIDYFKFILTSSK